MKTYIIRRLIAVSLLSFWISFALAVYFIVR